MKDYPVKCRSGATRMQSELLRAFELIAPKPNWKAAVDVKLPRGEGQWVNVDLLTDACVHFTGSVPTFSFAEAFLVRVQAAGYYATIGP